MTIGQLGVEPIDALDAHDKHRLIKNPGICQLVCQTRGLVLPYQKCATDATANKYWDLSTKGVLRGRECRQKGVCS
jgi:hypothetical protein